MSCHHDTSRDASTLEGSCKGSDRELVRGYRAHAGEPLTHRRTPLLVAGRFVHLRVAANKAFVYHED